MKLDRKGLERLIMEEYRALVKEAAGKASALGQMGSAMAGSGYIQPSTLDQFWKMHFQGNAVPFEKADEALVNVPLDTFTNLLSAMVYRYAQNNPDSVGDLPSILGNSYRQIQTMLQQVKPGASEEAPAEEDAQMMLPEPEGDEMEAPMEAPEAPQGPEGMEAGGTDESDAARRLEQLVGGMGDDEELGL